MKFMYKDTSENAEESKIVYFSMYGVADAGSPSPHVISFESSEGSEGSFTRIVQYGVNHTEDNPFTIEMKNGVEYTFTVKEAGTMLYVKKIEYLIEGTDIITLNDDVEEESNTFTLDSKLNDPKSIVREIRLRRTLKGNQWNTFVSPVSLSSTTIPKLREVLGTRTVYTIKDYNPDTYSLTFNAVTSISAGEPILIKPEYDVKDPVFEVKNGFVTEAGSASSNGLDYVGVFGAKNIYNANNPKSVLFLASNGTDLLYPNSENTGRIRGFRAYFQLPVGSGINHFVFEDDATGITRVEKNILNENGSIYTIDGRLVGNQETNLPSGLYIRNGRKFIVK